MRGSIRGYRGRKFRVRSLDETQRAPHSELEGLLEFEDSETKRFFTDLQKLVVGTEFIFNSGRLDSTPPNTPVLHITSVTRCDEQ